MAGAVAAALLLLTAPAAPAVAAVPGGGTGTGGRIAWDDCADPALTAAGAECGTLRVPLDHADPGGPKITLALSRIRHTAPDSDYQGVLLAVPNPLGGSGYTDPLQGALLPDRAGAAYDWVGFARRGLAPSSPALTCDPDVFAYDRPPYAPATPAEEAAWVARTESYATACDTGPQSALLDHMKATDTAADMEYIRAALGAGRLNLYARSYGTYTAQVYATLHPDRVRRAVLDSNVDPRRVWYNAANFDQNVGLEENLRLWFDWLATHNSVYGLGTTRAEVTAEWDRQIAAVTAAPAAGVIGPDEWADLFLVAPYFQSSWPLLGAAFAGWVHDGDAVTLRALYDQLMQHGDDNTYAAMLAQICTDAPWPASWRTWRADTVASARRAPGTTWGNTWFNAPCRTWGAEAGTPVRVNGSAVAPVLLVHETLDAATPYAGSLEVRSRFPRASLVAVPGGISNGPTPGSHACVDAHIAAYLTTGELPARVPGRGADAECAAGPAPTPYPTG
ncbi:alpha/beta fold hydrolase [Streptomyces sp. NPDC093252]|uniref:alpha/beta fold hydrolase n=1 Tax=Streptomyces sp. NPDC093252 TaxID=3154980 RepID=UPI00342C8B06